jgi:hypothetical protein
MLFEAMNKSKVKEKTDFEEQLAPILAEHLSELARSCS